MQGKILFPFTHNDNNHHYNTITSYTKFGYVKEGKEFIDTSLGSCGSFMLGFDRFDIIDYVTDRAKQIPFVSGEYLSTTESVLELSEKLYRATNGFYSFYSLSGSDAIEGAIKLADLYHISIGNTKKHKVLGISESYHGSTYLSSSISGGSLMTSILGRSDKCVSVNRNDDETILFDNIQQKIQEIDSQYISCLLLESCSWLGGLQKYSKDFWQQLKDLCKKSDILLIIDDIAMCGGKVGKLKGFEVDPDIFVMGKSLSGGYFPLSACFMSEQVFNVVKDSFWSHGFTYSFSLGGIYSTLKYMQIIEDEKVFENFTPLKMRSNSMFDRMVHNNLIQSYTTYGLYYNLKFFPVDNIEYAKEVFFQNGLNVGIQNYEWKGLRLIIPLLADDNYFHQLESRLQNALIHLS